ncbi:MAG: HAD family phosphatase [Cyclobacteriaceae bacterium]|nr:HAD family phosphatase [Cyclobacteriaceae bacterium]
MNGNTQFVLGLKGIKNIIFDLGGVIINLSVEKTHQAFASLSGMPVEEIKSIVHQGAYFHDYERGLISDAEFRTHLRQSLGLQVPDAQLDAAWNAMLLNIPMERIDLLVRLKERFSIYLLSNTNNIHLQCFNGIVKNLTGHSTIDNYFHKAYYSHLLKLSKPDVAIYNHVLLQNGLVPESTIFLDDNKDNLTGANKAGIKTFHVQHPDQIFSLFL